MTHISPAATRTGITSHQWTWIMLLGGVALILARLIIPARPGLIFKASITNVQNICHSTLGIFAIASNHEAASSCSEADAIMTGLTIGAAAGLVLVVLAGARLHRARAVSRA
jgi:hypothetical protein